jgi:hypothetical protein
VDAALTESRARVAELNLEAERTRSRLALQAKQIGAIEERMTAGEVSPPSSATPLPRASAWRPSRKSATPSRIICANANGRSNPHARRSCAY